MAIGDKESRGRSVYVGPSLRPRHEQQARIDQDNLIRDLKADRQRAVSLSEKYGEDLRDYAKAYFGSLVDTYGLGHLRGDVVPKDFARGLLVNHLAEALANQPEGQRKEWLEGFLRDFDGKQR